jgi:hypothetical protein
MKRNANGLDHGDEPAREQATSPSASLQRASPAVALLPTVSYALATYEGAPKRCFSRAEIEMSRLQGRLRKLEACLTDRSGLVPHTQEWVDYWTTRMGG